MKLFVPQSLKWRLQAWHGLLLLLVLGGFGVTAYQLQWTNLWRRMDADLQARVGRLLSELRAGSPPPPHRGPPPRGPGAGPEGPPEGSGFEPPPLHDFRVTGAAAGPFQSTSTLRL